MVVAAGLPPSRRVLRVCRSSAGRHAVAGALPPVAAKRSCLRQQRPVGFRVLPYSGWAGWLPAAKTLSCDARPPEL